MHSAVRSDQRVEFVRHDVVQRDDVAPRADDDDAAHRGAAESAQLRAPVRPGLPERADGVVRPGVQSELRHLPQHEPKLGADADDLREPQGRGGDTGGLPHVRGRGVRSVELSGDPARVRGVGVLRLRQAGAVTGRRRVLYFTSLDFEDESKFHQSS